MFMADGSALGIRQCEILNRTIQSLSVSRGRLPELFSWSEIDGAGVYFLFGKAESGADMAYIGEGQKVVERLKSHLREKAFWSEVVVFVNKDENINPKYLEAKLIQEAVAAERYVLDNGKHQVVPHLSRADTAAMEEMIPDIRLILGVLGHRIFEPVVPAAASPDAEVARNGPRSTLDREFVFSGPSFSARARVTDEGFVILKESSAASEFGVGSAGYRQLRERLIEEGALKPANGCLVFTRDVVTTSSSQAASIVAGGNRSGPGSWKSGGKTLSELEEELSGGD
jgi:hypothetical protein